jgi:ornithine decarboxylase
VAVDKGQFTDVTAVARALRPSYPVYCLRPDVLAASARRFIKQFPGTVLYAVKCNPHPLVLSALYKGGIRHFDTASLTEIAQVTDAFEDAHTYFMHPVKARAVINSAYQIYGVRHFVVDHMDELNKVVQEVGAQGNTTIVRVNTPPASSPKPGSTRSASTSAAVFPRPTATARCRRSTPTWTPFARA